MNIFKSPFEKLSADNLSQIAQNTAVTALALSPGGELFKKFDVMIATLAKIEQNTRSGAATLGTLDKATLKLIGPAAQGVANAMKILVDALIAAPASKEMDMKVNALVKGIAAVTGLGKAIFAFAGWLALSLPLLLLGMIALPLAVLMIGAVAGLFFLIDKMGIDRTIKRTATGLAIAGLAIISLSGALALSSIILGAVFGGQGVGAAISVGLFLTTLVLGTALVFGIAGMFAPNILSGALAIGVAGLSILLLSGSMAIFTLAVPPTTEGWNSILQVNALVISLGTVMALAGMASMFIIPGALAMIAAGIALIAIGAGLAVIGSVVKPGKFDYLLADSGHETESFLGFGGGRMMSNMEWMLQSIAYSFALSPKHIASMYLSAPAMIMAGTALVVIAKGIEKFQALDIDYALFPEQMSKVVGVLADGFAEVGKKYPGGGGGFMSALFGSGTDTSVVAQGISAVGGMGRALSGIAMGVQAMAMLKFPTKWDKNGNPIEFRQLQDSDFEAVTINTQKIVGALSSTFGKIGAMPEAADPWGWFGHSKIEEGIQITAKIGGAVSSLAQGVQGIAEFKMPIYQGTKIIGYKTLNDAGVLDGATANIQRIVAALSSTFGKIGADPNAQDTWGWFGNSNVEEGIEIVQKIANPIVNLVSVIKKFAELDQATFDTAEGKISSILAKSSSIFANATQSGWTASELEDAADAFEDMADSMDDWKDAVNELDLQKVTEVRKLYEGLAYLSKNGGETAIERMGESLIEAVNHLSDLLQQAGEKKGPFANLLAAVGVGESAPAESKPAAAQGAQSPAASNAGNAELKAAIEKLTRLMGGTLDVNVVSSRQF